VTTYVCADLIEGVGTLGGVEPVQARWLVRFRSVLANERVAHCRSLAGGANVVNGHRSVVDRVDGDGDRSHIAVDLTVVDLEGEGVRAVVVGSRRVGAAIA
jgi:hypothetical protein